jgi:hypothetical protein
MPPKRKSVCEDAPQAKQAKTAAAPNNAAAKTEASTESTPTTSKAKLAAAKPAKVKGSDGLLLRYTIAR